MLHFDTLSSWAQRFTGPDVVGGRLLDVVFGCLVVGLALSGCTRKSIADPVMPNEIETQRPQGESDIGANDRSHSNSKGVLWHKLPVRVRLDPQWSALSSDLGQVCGLELEDERGRGASLSLVQNEDGPVSPDWVQPGEYQAVLRCEFDGIRFAQTLGAITIPESPNEYVIPVFHSQVKFPTFASGEGVLTGFIQSDSGLPITGVEVRVNTWHEELTLWDIDRRQRENIPLLPTVAEWHAAFKSTRVTVTDAKGRWVLNRLSNDLGLRYAVSLPYQIPGGFRRSGTYARVQNAHGHEVPINDVGSPLAPIRIGSYIESQYDKLQKVTVRLKLDPADTLFGHVAGPDARVRGEFSRVRRLESARWRPYSFGRSAWRSGETREFKSGTYRADFSLAMGRGKSVNWTDIEISIAEAIEDQDVEITLPKTIAIRPKLTVPPVYVGQKLEYRILPSNSIRPSPRVTRGTSDLIELKVDGVEGLHVGNPGEYAIEVFLGPLIVATLPVSVPPNATEVKPALSVPVPDSTNCISVAVSVPAGHDNKEVTVKLIPSWVPRNHGIWPSEKLVLESIARPEGDFLIPWARHFDDPNLLDMVLEVRHPSLGLWEARGMDLIGRRTVVALKPASELTVDLAGLGTDPTSSRWAIILASKPDPRDFVRTSRTSSGMLSPAYTHMGHSGSATLGPLQPGSYRVWLFRYQTESGQRNDRLIGYRDVTISTESARETFDVSGLRTLRVDTSEVAGCGYISVWRPGVPVLADSIARTAKGTLPFHHFQPGRAVVTWHPEPWAWPSFAGAIGSLDTPLRRQEAGSDARVVLHNERLHIDREIPASVVFDLRSEMTIEFTPIIANALLVCLSEACSLRIRGELVDGDLIVGLDGRKFGTMVSYAEHASLSWGCDLAAWRAAAQDPNHVHEPVPMAPANAIRKLIVRRDTKTLEVEVPASFTFDGVDARLVPVRSE